MKLYSLWCEYDYGQENMVFVSEKDAKEFLQNQIENQEDDWTALELWDDGLAAVEELQFYGR